LPASLPNLNNHLEQVEPTTFIIHGQPELRTDNQNIVGEMMELFL